MAAAAAAAAAALSFFHFPFDFLSEDSAPAWISPISPCLD
jgi:hypothetical protein